ncbi:hypothetical protein M433DRAFT_544074 [Acidomyces richmondensis BFW]|nr:hypothetical protein M433DRAFT_544074 [Acidomyces richmondensis BFW]
MIDGNEEKYYRHQIRGFSFIEMNVKEKRTAYKFTTQFYNIWMPKHFMRIGSTIDPFLSGVNFDLSQYSELHFTD